MGRDTPIEILFRLREKDGGTIRGLNPNIGNPLFGFKDWEIMMD